RSLARTVRVGIGVIHEKYRIVFAVPRKAAANPARILLSEDCAEIFSVLQPSNLFLVKPDAIDLPRLSALAVPVLAHETHGAPARVVGFAQHDSNGARVVRCAGEDRHLA